MKLPSFFSLRSFYQTLTFKWKKRRFEFRKAPGIFQCSKIPKPIIYILEILFFIHIGYSLLFTSRNSVLTGRLIFIINFSYEISPEKALNSFVLPYSFHIYVFMNGSHWLCGWVSASKWNHINCNHKYDIWREGKTLQPQNTGAHKTIGNVRCGFQKMGKYIYSPNPVLIWFFPSFHWPIFTLYWWTTVKRGKLTIVNAWVKWIENVLHCFSNLHISSFPFPIDEVCNTPRIHL